MKTYILVFAVLLIAGCAGSDNSVSDPEEVEIILDDKSENIQDEPAADDDLGIDSLFEEDDGFAPPVFE